jgi:hypothetical protein
MLKASPSPFVFLSGRPQEWQVEVTNSFLKKHELNHEKLVQWDLENKECEKKKRVVLQLCFKDEDLFVVKIEKERLEKTIALLVAAPPPKYKGDVKEELKRKRPSTRGPKL